MQQVHHRLIGVFGLAFAIIVSSVVPMLANAQGTPAAAPAALANLASNATFETDTCPFAVPDTFVEGETLECGYLTTPMLHAEPNGEQIRLFVIQLASPASDELDTPLVFLAGGPGQGGSSQLTAYLPDGPLRPLLEQQDVILIDQRGSGFSEPGLFCPTDAGPSVIGLMTPTEATPAATTPQPEATPDATNLFGPDVDGCRASFDEAGIDLAAFSSAESAADINDLRVALGYEQIDLFGASYGTQLGLVVERDFPSIVRAAVLSSPLPPVANRFSGQVVAFDQALDTAIAQCEADPDCAAANPNLSANFDLAVEQLTAEPLDVEIKDPATGASLGSIPLDAASFSFSVYQSLLFGPFVANVPSLITAAVNGETEPFGVILGVAYSGVTSTIATGLSNTIICTEENAFVDAEEEAAIIAEAGVRESLANSESFNIVAAYEAICGIWNLPAADPIETEPVVSDVPTLVVTGEFDPITPPSYGELAVETLENGYLVEIPGSSHDPASASGPAGVQLVVDFLVDPDQRPDTRAIEQNQVDFSPEQ